jgi:hypothetical protein
LIQPLKFRSKSHHPMGAPDAARVHVITLFGTAFQIRRQQTA